MPEIAYGDFVEFIDDDGNKYFLARLGNVYSCTCQSWKQQTVAEHRRTCLHLQRYRGAEDEKNRIEGLKSKAKVADKKIAFRKLYVYAGSSECTLDDLVEVITDLDIDRLKVDKYTVWPVIYFKNSRHAYLEVKYYRDPERSNYTKGDPRPVVMIISKISFIQEEEADERLSILVDRQLIRLGFKPR